jgi:hypothetical protein
VHISSSFKSYRSAWQSEDLMHMGTSNAFLKKIEIHNSEFQKKNRTGNYLSHKREKKYV